MGIKIAKQYIKELAIAVPKSPEVFVNPQDKPNIDISIDIDAKKISDLAYEVILQLKSQADNGNLFTSNIHYAGIFAFDEEEDINNLEETLLVTCPNLLFPFARSIMANLTADAGFSPMLLDPIDFKKLYQKRQKSATIN